MKKILIIFNLMIVLISINFVSATLYYNVSIKYDNGKMNINDVNVIFSQTDLSSLYGDYYLELRQDHDTLNNYQFNVPNTIAYDTADESGKINGGGIITLNETEFEVFIPYTESADEMIITDSNKAELAKKDIIYLSKNVISNQITKDFEIIKGKSESNIFYEDSNNSNNYLMIGIVILIVTVIIILIIVFTRKPDKLKKKN
jgi:hypothetical protein